MQSSNDRIPCVVKRGAWFSWRADRASYVQAWVKKKNRIGNSITSIPQLRIIMMADLCGPSSQGASRELSRSAGDSHMAWMQSQQIDQNLTYTGLSIVRTWIVKVFYSYILYFYPSASDMQNSHIDSRQNNCSPHLCTFAPSSLDKVDTDSLLSSVSFSTIRITITRISTKLENSIPHSSLKTVYVNCNPWVPYWPLLERWCTRGRTVLSSPNANTTPTQTNAYCIVCHKSRCTRYHTPLHFMKHNLV